jgi:hypothetical protein
MMVNSGREDGKGGSPVWDNQLRDSDVPAGLDTHGRGSAGDRLGEEIVAVCREPPDSNEEGTGANLAAVMRHVEDGCPGRPRNLSTDSIRQLE